MLRVKKKAKIILGVIGQGSQEMLGDRLGSQEMLESG